MNNREIIDIRCRRCNRLMMQYYTCADSNGIVLQGIGVKCERCKRVVVFKKYTEEMIKHRIDNGSFKI